MISDHSTQSYKVLLGIPEHHRLTLSDNKRVQRKSTVYETRWFEEQDEQGIAIARYRTWSNQCLKPPYRKQLGWERFSMSGNLLDREIRYSQRETNQYLH